MVSQKKQVKRLKKNAQRLWSDQQALLDRANKVGHDALPHAQHFAQSVYDERVRPAAKKGAFAGRAAGKYAGSTARDAVQGTLFPAVSSAAAAAVALAEEAGSRLGLGDTALADQGKKARKRLNKATRKGRRSELKARVKLKGAAKAGKLAAKQGQNRIAKATGQKSGIGVGGVIGIVLGVGVLAAIGYAVWQTLRADDDLWVADEDPEITPATDEPTS